METAITAAKQANSRQRRRLHRIAQDALDRPVQVKGLGTHERTKGRESDISELAARGAPNSVGRRFGVSEDLPPVNQPPHSGK